MQQMNVVFCKGVKFIKDKHPQKDNISRRRCLSRTCCRCIRCPTVPSFIAYKWPRGLSLPPSKPLNTRPITATTAGYITNGQHPQVVDRVGHWGKLSYKQGGTVLKVVTWQGGDISTPGGCPPADAGGTRDPTWSLPATTPGAFPWVLCCRRC